MANTWQVSNTEDRAGQNVCEMAGMQHQRRSALAIGPARSPYFTTGETLQSIQIRFGCNLSLVIVAHDRSLGAIANTAVFHT